MAREYFTLSFKLDGPTDMFPPKIWFSNGKGEDDVLYFGPQAGYLGSFKHFVRAITLLDPSEMLKVRKLAVHEDLFLQIRRERGPFDWNPNANRSKDALTERCLEDFWDHVKRKFRNVEEVCIVGTGMEHEILSYGSSCEEKQMLLATTQTCRQKTAGRPQESLHAKVARAVGKLQAEDESWVSPRWRLLAFQDRVVIGRKPRRNSVRKVRSQSSGEIHVVENMQYIMDNEKRGFELDVTML